MTRHRRRWASRATLPAEKGKYASARAKAIAMPPSKRAAACEERRLWLKCGCNRFSVRVGCGQRWYCEKCRARYYRSVRRKLRRSMGEAYRTRPARCYDWALLTLTVKHSGDVGRDRERIRKGWQRLRQWAWKRWGRFAYALTWEVTPGRDGLGHVHGHVAVLWPKLKHANRWLVDFGELQQEWQSATETKHANIDVKWAEKGVGGAAKYLAKYASKGVQPRKLPPILGANVFGAFYNKRVVSAAHGFWRAKRKRCKCCGERWEVTELPDPLTRVAPSAVLDSFLVRAELDSARGPPHQLSYPWGEGGAPRQTQTARCPSWATT